LPYNKPYFRYRAPYQRFLEAEQFGHDVQVIRGRRQLEVVELRDPAFASASFVTTASPLFR
jgi:hypothetical protein